jgi:acetaldehyde dehydrogenase/alcohol dehydrogenase
MAHKLGAAFNIAHGMANALLINQVIRFNATDCPKKQAIFPQYKFPNAKAKYGQIADELNLGGNSDDEKIELLLNAITELKKEIGIPLSIKDAGVTEDKFYAKLNELAELAFDDQCTGANPVYPFVEDLKALLIKAYNGEI